MRDAFVAALTEATAADQNVMLLTGDLGFGVLNEFAERFPQQYLNVGVAEQNMAGVAAGLAHSGKKVFTYSIANFPTLRCLEQIRNDICYHDLPVTTVAIGGGLSYGPLGFSHQATEDLAIMRALPNMTVVAPTHDNEAAQATRVLAAHRGPSYLRLDRSAPLVNGMAETPFALGRAAISADWGSDVLLAVTGAVAGVALEAAQLLREAGVGTTVLAFPTVKPLDEQALRMQFARNFALVVSIEEHSVIGGLGSALAEAMCGPALAGQVPALLRRGIPDTLPTIVGSQNYLRQHFGLEADALYANAMVELDRIRGG